eukprot:scaffold13777_cov42-Phaeocystis_antarctica.AAC.1
MKSASSSSCSCESCCTACVSSASSCSSNAPAAHICTDCTSHCNALRLQLCWLRRPCAIQYSMLQPSQMFRPYERASLHMHLRSHCELPPHLELLPSTGLHRHVYDRSGARWARNMCDRADRADRRAKDAGLQGGRAARRGYR